MPLNFKITKIDMNSKARTGVLEINGRSIKTPAYIAPATRAEVIGFPISELKSLGIESIMVNTYHLDLAPDTILNNGTVREILNYHGLIFSDSAGFQVLSLGRGKEQGVRKQGFFPNEQKNKQNKEEREENLVKISQEGVEFISVYDSKKNFINAEKSMEIQSRIGSDAIMAFDECPTPFDGEDYVREAWERTKLWELKSLECHDKKQAIYGILHGGYFKKIREESAKFITSQNFDGIAIGGPLGKSKKEMIEILDWIAPSLDNRPVHMLGIGYVQDIFECVQRGVDTFDCVAPTREARHGQLYVSPSSGGTLENRFKINIKREIYKNDFSKLEEDCDCVCCAEYTRSRLRELCKLAYNQDSKISQEVKVKARDEYIRVASIHNVYFIERLLRKIRVSINSNSFLKLKKEWLRY